MNARRVMAVRQHAPTLRCCATLLALAVFAAPLVASCEPLCMAEDMECCSPGPMPAVTPPCCASAAAAPANAVAARTSPEVLKASSPPVATIAPVLWLPGRDTTGRYPPDWPAAPRSGAVPLFLLHASFLS